MREDVRAVHALVGAVDPVDAAAVADAAWVQTWLEGTDDVYRRARPATPPVHLVGYVLLRDPADGSVLLVDHVRSGLWLPPGGHVEPGERPADAALREAAEELGIEGRLASPVPRLVTVNPTNDGTHTDVSLWFELAGRRGMSLAVDPREARSARWWTPDELPAADPSRSDPHLARFAAAAG